MGMLPYVPKFSEEELFLEQLSVVNNNNLQKYQTSCYWGTFLAIQKVHVPPIPHTWKVRSDCRE